MRARIPGRSSGDPRGGATAVARFDGASSRPALRRDEIRYRSLRPARDRRVAASRVRAITLARAVSIAETA